MTNPSAAVIELVVRQPLRGYDAVELATALHVQASGTSVEFGSTDETRRAAALAEGLRVVVPQ